MVNYYIGFDTGTSGTKVAIYSGDSKLIAEAYRPNNIYYPTVGWAEMEPNQFYKAVVEGIKECIKKSKINPKNVRAISCSGVICGFVPIDENWNKVYNYIPYLDNRAKEEAKYINENIDPIWIEENGNSQVGAYIPPVILKWLINNKKEIVQQTSKVVTAAHYVMGKLGGLHAKDAFIDWGHLSGWVIGWKGKDRNWSYEQLKLLGIPIEILPTVKKPWDIVGYLTQKAAEETGLIKGVPLIAGSGDMQQSCFGSGVIELGMCSDIAATASNFNIAIENFNIEKTSKKTFMYAMDTLGELFIAWAVIPGGGLSLKWFKDNVMDRSDDSKFYENMSILAEKAGIGSKNVLFFPFLQGRTNPVWSNSSAAWIGLYALHDAASLWRSILESIAFEYLTWLNTIKGFGLEPIKIIGQGGGSKDYFWDQIKADILNLPYLILEKSEPTLLGNALLGAFGVGDLKNLHNAVKEWSKIKKTFFPNQENNEIYNKIYEQREKILNGPIKEAFNMMADFHLI